LIIKIETDAGIYGLGEAGLSGRELAVIGAIDHYSNWLVGRDPFSIGALWQEMYRSQYFEGGRVLMAAISAIDIALHDIKAKAFKIPVYQLLGGKQRDVIPCFTTVKAESGEKALSEVKRKLEGGWKVIRLFPIQTNGDAKDILEPRESVRINAYWVKRIRDELDSDFVFGLDFHHRLSVAETASFCQKVSNERIEFLEEPIRSEMPKAYETLRSMTCIPLAIGEEFSSKWDFAPYIEGGLADFIRLDISNAGGFTEAIKIAGWAEAHYKDVMPHNPLGVVSTAAAVHLCAAIPNLSWLELSETAYSQSNSIFVDPPVLDNTSYRITDKPGLGVELREELIPNEPFRYWEPPHLHRVDGSYTNW
jgi:galactonate dehydratase